MFWVLLSTDILSLKWTGRAPLPEIVGFSISNMSSSLHSLQQQLLLLLNIECIVHDVRVHV